MTAAAARWAREWGRAWRDHDVERVAALYAPGARFHSHPFRAAQAPADYAAWAFASEEAGADVRFEEPFLAATDRAVVEWRAVTVEDGAETTLAGVSFLRFDESGLVVEQRDYWAQKPGRHAPFPP
jgi:hypothetical protein